MVPLEMMYLTQIIDDSLHSGLKCTILKKIRKINRLEMKSISIRILISIFQNSIISLTEKGLYHLVY